MPWDPKFLERSELLSVFAEPFGPLLEFDEWPSLSDYSAIADAQRLLRAPCLDAVAFVPMGRGRQRGRRGGRARDLAESYDGSIALAGRVPCVPDSYHDCCNALAWAAFPRAKRTLHLRQFQALVGRVTVDASRWPNRRSREQDALTLFDEGGAVLVREVAEVPPCPTANPAAVTLDASSLEGSALPVDHQRARLVVFGHALMEHLAFNAQSLHAAAVVLDCVPPLPSGVELLELVDVELARRLTDKRAFEQPWRLPCVELLPPHTAWLRT